MSTGTCVGGNTLNCGYLNHKHLQSLRKLTAVLTPLKVQYSDFVGLEITMSTSTESPDTRGESLISDTTNGGTLAGAVNTNT